MSNQTSQSERKHTPLQIGSMNIPCQIDGFTTVSPPDMPPLAYFAYRPDAAKYVSCVNAMQGIDDPAEYVRVFGEMVEAAGGILDTIDGHSIEPTGCYTPVNTTELSQSMDTLRSALTAYQQSVGGSNA